jgi:Glycosyl hydrolase family 26
MRHRITRRLPIAAIALLTLAGCGNPGFSKHEDARRWLTPPAHVTLPARSSSYLGVYEADVPQSYSPLQHFTAVTGCRPNLVLYYSSWGEQFQAVFADELWTHGAVLLDQIDPKVSLNAIAAGKYDTYIRAYATQVRTFGRPVVIGFGPEMNGPWHSWGSGHISPTVWVAAWRNLVRIFRQQGAGNVTWLWTINRLNRGSGAPQLWWPGAKYVNWVGIDGYFNTPADTFESTFGQTITAVRSFTAKPVLLSATAVHPGADPEQQIPALFAGVRLRHLLGFVWFDEPSRYDWRLENSASDLALFRKEVSHDLVNVPGCHS